MFSIISRKGNGTTFVLFKARDAMLDRGAAHRHEIKNERLDIRRQISFFGGRHTKACLMPIVMSPSRWPRVLVPVLSVFYSVVATIHEQYIWLEAVVLFQNKDVRSI